MPRESNIVRIVGKQNYERLRDTKILLVGAGGIGCELLKNLILMEFGEIHIVDLDTIDLSNLNRQFLFRQRDIKQPKSSTAVKAVQHFNNSKLVAYQANIMDTDLFPMSWFEQFTIFFNALDNLGARRYVNKMALFLDKPLLESGTAGFDGYVQPIIPRESECFDCTIKETPKTFPVCTIRSTPSQPIHCIVWAKNFLFSQLFASNATGESSVTPNEDFGTEDPEEIERIKQETSELHELQQYVKSQDESRVADIIEKLFVQDVKKLLKIDNLWKTRTKPVPIEGFKITNEINNNLNSDWSLQENLNKFVEVTIKLMKRLPQEQNIEFDKDDQDTLEFVATAANIRAHVFHIPKKSVFDIKQIAGNIIPAIATTNAIIAGLSSLISLRVLKLISVVSNEPRDLHMAFTAKASNMSTNRYLSNSQLAPSNKNCAVCSRVLRAVIRFKDQDAFSHTSLNDLINAIREKYTFPEEISLIDTSGNRLLADCDFDDLLDRSLESLSLSAGKVLLFSDEEGDVDGLHRKPVEFYLELSNSIEQGFQLPELKVPLYKPDPIFYEEHEDQQDTKEKTLVTGENGEIILDDDDDDDDDDNNSSNNNSNDNNAKTGTYTKKRSLEESGGPTTKRLKGDDDIIELD